MEYLAAKWYALSGMEPETWLLTLRVDWPKRKEDIGGPDTQWAYPYNYFGDKPYKNITLDYELNLGEIGGIVKVREVMDILDASLCYDYS